MAQKTIVTITSDLSGKDDANTYSFGLDGTDFEIDLTKSEKKKLDAALAEYVSAARKAGGKRAGAKAASSGPNPAEVREWAKANGFKDLPARGRIPFEVRDAFLAAQK